MSEPGRPQIGILLPTREMAISGRYSMDQLLDFARAAEDLGFDSLWAGDSLTARPRLDPLIVLACAAAVTHRIKLGSAALTAALRTPVVGANAVAALDHAAGGRLIVGVGSGFPMPESEREFEVAGVPFTNRAARLDEVVALWRRAWSSGAGDAGTAGGGGGGGGAGAAGDAGGAGAFSGRWYTVDGLDRLPPPHSPGGPPVWLAASDTPRVVRRVAEHYDGWLPFVPTADAYAAGWQRIREAAAAAGRAAGAITAGLYGTVLVDSDERRAASLLDSYVQAYYGYPLELVSAVQAYGYGTPQACADWLAGYLRAGARHVVIRIGSLEPVPELLGLLKATADALLPLAHQWPHDKSEGEL